MGPDLTSIGASAPPDYLVESLLYPNRKVKEGYHSLLLETKDGQEFSGILVRETDEQIIIRDATNREVSVPKNDISKRSIAGSIMPSGLIDALSSEEQTDLYRFLVELGKPGPFDASKGNVARSWKLMAATIDLAQFGDERALGTDWNNKAWSPAHSYVDGRLPKDALQSEIKAVASRDPSSLYAAAQFQVAAPGRVTVRLAGSPYAAAWLNGKPLRAEQGTVTDLAAGVHTVVVKLDAKQLPEFLRLETSDGTFLTQ